MRNRLRQLGDERGFALVLALAATVVLGITATSVIIYTTANQRTSHVSKGRISAYDLAEAGINNAASILSKSNGFDQHVLHPQGTHQPADCASPPANPAGTPLLGNTCSPLVYTYDGGTATVSGWLDTNTGNWTVTSTGAVNNAFATNQTEKTLTATMHVRATPSQDNYVTAWNYVFLRDTTPGICNLALQNSVTVSISLYVSGNLCFENTSAVAETDNPGDGIPEDVNLEVLGRVVWQNGSSKGVGDTSLTSPTNGAVTTAKIAGGCATSLTGPSHACSTPGDYFYVQPGGYSETAPPITIPALTDTDFQNYYDTAYIRPGDPCDDPGPNGSNRLPNSAFDNDSIPLNGAGGNGSGATFNLTPNSSYTCRATDATGAVIGELDWDNVNKILSIRGTIYVDGSLTITQAGSYRGVNVDGVHPSGDTSGLDGVGGQAVIYASGGFTMSNNIQLCGWNTRTDSTAKVGNTCDFNLWTPNTSMLMLVLHKLGAGSVSFSQSGMFQGGIYSLGDVSTANSVEIHGPMLVNSVTIGNSVKLRPIPYITDLPIGAPGNPNSNSTVDGVTFTGG
jgi:Tfp pilus assembly protein PilX